MRITKATKTSVKASKKVCGASDKPLTKDQVKDLWDKKALFVDFGDSDAMCQDNGYTLDQVYKFMDEGNKVYVDSDVEACGDVKCSTGGSNMRIVKSNKTVKAANETGDSDIPTYKLAQQILDCDDWEEFGFSCEEECNWCKKKAKKLLDERDGVNACGDVKASKKLSANDQALQHIKAAIDILGKSGNKDEVTKDSIANLGVVMFDLKGSQK